MKLNLPSTLAFFATAIAFSATATAQNDYRQNDYRTTSQDVQGVTVYEHCEYRGKSQTLRPDDYASLRAAGFGNDSVSSIRVPQGVEAVLYADDNFRGAYTRVDRDIACFDRQWNDQASSIRVSETRDNNRDNRSDRGQQNDRARNGQVYDNSNRDNRNRDNQNNGRRGNDQQNQANVTAQNVAQVVFDGSSLQQVAEQQWTLDSPRGASKQYQEVRRDRDAVYLENKFTAERVRIDLFANDVTLVSRDGRQQRYNIDRKNAALGSSNDSRPNNAVTTVPSSQNRTIASECFSFKAYTNGGNASLRFHGKDELYRFNQTVSTDRICHNGTLTMEIGKTEPGTDVTVEINGNRYRFSAGEKEDNFLNNWYRKSIKLRVGK